MQKGKNINSSRKKKKLPVNFEEMLKTADVLELKAVYEKCELSAYTGYSKTTALGLPGVPEELVRWLVEQGLDVDSPDGFHKTPLQSQITAFGSIDTIELLIELGADLEFKYKLYDYTALHYAASYRRADIVQLLITHGADMFAKDRNSLTPLELSLFNCRPVDIAKTAKVAETFLSSGVQRLKSESTFLHRLVSKKQSYAEMFVTDKAKELIGKIGSEFEFYRSDFNKDMLGDTLSALDKLYKMFGAEPAPVLKKHDGISDIKATCEKWREQHDELWRLLVPVNGHADTVQGEVIRITGRAACELMDNGGMNWDGDYRKMLDFLSDKLAQGTPLPTGELSEALDIIRKIYNGKSGEEPERLMELAVHWVAQNPEPIKLEKVGYSR